MSEKMIVVLVHGWSVTNTDTYGELADRLEAESRAGRIPPIEVQHLFLSRYISFHDEVRVPDLSRGFEAALRAQVGSKIDAGAPVACITHSTGGPVIRDWWHEYYLRPGRPCPMTHLIMLAPANFGSALARLGKARIGQLKSFLSGVEPGVGVLDWLEHGSAESFAINKEWILGEHAAPQSEVFPFVLTGQTIDRKLYDHANSYTGELGSDGVVRVAAANLNARYVKLVQDAPPPGPLGKDDVLRLRVERQASDAIAPETAFRLIEGKSHSGDNKGILKTIGRRLDSNRTVAAIRDCLKVGTRAQYDKLLARFAQQTKKVYQDERVEFIDGIFKDNYYIHDAHSLVIVRLRDTEGRVPDSYDLKFLGRNNNPDRLPPGFFGDVQGNRLDSGTLTYYLNSDILHRCDAVRYKNKVVRKEQTGVEQIGLEIIPRPRDGFVRYARARLSSNARNLDLLIRPHETTLVDVVLRRIVGRGVYKLSTERKPESFKKKQKPGVPIR